MAAKSNPVAELAEKMVQTLRDQRDQGGTYPLTLKRLTELADPAAADDLRAKAAKAKGFSGAVVLAQKKDPDTPLALAEDLDRLAASPVLLERLLEQTCSPAAPTQPVDKLVKKVEAPLRDPLAAAIERQLQEGTLPETTAAVTIKGKPHLYLKRLPPPTAPAVALAEKLVQALRERRDRGQSYPMPFRQLLDEAAAGVDPALLKKALKEDAYQHQVVRADAKDDEAPAALAGDRGRMAGSDAVLDYALARVCTSRKRTASVEELSAALAPWLKQDFEAAVQRRLREGKLPEGVGSVTLGQQTVLYRQALPPEATTILTAKLLQELRTRRELGGNAYPVTLTALAEAVGTQPSSPHLHHAAADKSFKTEVVLAVSKSTDTPVALKGDEDTLAASPLLIEHLLTAARSDSNQAIPAVDLKKKLAKPLQSAFTHALHDRIGTHSLPAGIGLLRIKKKEHLFLLKDVNAAAPAAATAEPRPATEQAASVALLPEPDRAAAVTEPLAPSDFAVAFEEAYTRLDREKGGSDFVSLVELRRALPSYDREMFDSELRKLRRAGLYTLSTAEGRHGLTPEEQEAGIREEGTLMLSVSRKRS